MGKNSLVFSLVVLSLLLVAGIEFCLATDGYVAYRSASGINSYSSPKIRYWNNTALDGNGSFGSEVELPSAGSPVKTLVLKQSPISSKIVLVTMSDDGNLDGYICMHECQDPNNWNFSSNIGNVGIGPQRRFDISFESRDGDAVLAYAVVNANINNDWGFKVLYENNFSFNGLNEQFINDTSQNSTANLQYSWMALDSDPVTTSNEMIAEGFDTNSNDINGWVWNGTNFTRAIKVAGAATLTAAREALAVKYASDGSKAMIIAGNGTNGNFSSRYWNGTTWSEVIEFDINISNGNDISWLTLKADPTSDDLMATVIDSGADLYTIYWNGTTWNISNAVDATVDSIYTRVADFSWLPTGGQGRLIWDTDGAGTTLSSRICSPTCNTATQTFSTYSGNGSWMTLYRNPTVGEKVDFLGFRMNWTTFALGSFWYNGSGRNYTNYGDNAVSDATHATLATIALGKNESFYFDFRRDVRAPAIAFIEPNETGIILQGGLGSIINASSNEYLQYATLELNGTINYSMNGADMWWDYPLDTITEGFYSYKIFIKDLAGNMNVSLKWNFTLDYPPNITLVTPANNTLNITSRNITFFYNVTDNLDTVSKCSLIIDDIFVLNTSLNPVPESVFQNFSYVLNNGQHNWSVWCNDSVDLNSTSEIRNITINIQSVASDVVIDDGIIPDGEIMLNAGSLRQINCTAVVSDPEGIGNIKNVSATFFYSANMSNQSDDNNTHYSNKGCTLVNSTSSNLTYACGFNVRYFANNGTWTCRIAVQNNYSINISVNASTIIQPLYSVNVTDGLDFMNLSAGSISQNLTVNISNLGNMAVNVTLQGYARYVGDNQGMNCSDETNITITRIKFSTNVNQDYSQKTSMTGDIQPLSLVVRKQTSIPVYNMTYWQISPDGGSVDRICYGHIIFTAEAS